MFCICTTRVHALLAATEHLNLHVSLPPIPPIPPLLHHFVGASGVPAADSELLDQLRALHIPPIPILSGSVALSGLAALATTASGLGINLTTPAGLAALGHLCAQIDPKSLIPLLKIPVAKAMQLSQTLGAAHHLGAALGVNMATATPTRIASAVHEHLARSRADHLSRPRVAPPPPARVAALSRLQVVASLAAAFNAPLTPAGFTHLAVSLRDLIRVAIPPVVTPPALLAVASALGVIAGLGIPTETSTAGGSILAGSAQAASSHRGLRDILRALADSLQSAHNALQTAKWTPGPILPPASLAPVLTMHLPTVAALKWSIPAKIPAVTFALPALSLVASLNATLPVLATTRCGSACHNL